jgi:hypothetical protein
MLRQIRFILTLVAAFIVFGEFATPASACPMCKQANETKDDDRVPQAYMYSILFMLAVPATLLTGFGVSFYRMSKRSPHGEQTDSASPSADHHLLPQENDSDEVSH